MLHWDLKTDKDPQLCSTGTVRRIRIHTCSCAFPIQTRYRLWYLPIQTRYHSQSKQDTACVCYICFDYTGCCGIGTERDTVQAHNWFVEFASITECSDWCDLFVTADPKECACVHVTGLNLCACKKLKRVRLRACKRIKRGFCHMWQNRARANERAPMPRLAPVQALAQAPGSTAHTHECLVSMHDTRRIAHCTRFLDLEIRRSYKFVEFVAKTAPLPNAG
jgi:hypothetical protein